MARNRFTGTDVDRLPLSDGDWIEVKRDLNNGDHKRLEVAGMRPTVVDGRLFQPIDWAYHDIERASIFITKWSLQGPGKDPGDTQPVPYKGIDSLRALDPDTFDEINQAIINHVIARAAVKKQQREEKKVTAPPPVKLEAVADPISES